MAVHLYLPLSEETTGLKDSLLCTSEGPAVVVVILIRVESDNLDPFLYHSTITVTLTLTISISLN